LKIKKKEKNDALQRRAPSAIFQLIIKIVENDIFFSPMTNVFFFFFIFYLFIPLDEICF